MHVDGGGRLQVRPGDGRVNQQAHLARVDPGVGAKGSNPIFFEIKAQNHDKIAVREKASFLLP